MKDHGKSLMTSNDSLYSHKTSTMKSLRHSVQNNYTLPAKSLQAYQLQYSILYSSALMHTHTVLRKHAQPLTDTCLEVHEEPWLIYYEGKPDVLILNLPKLQGPLTGSFDRGTKSLQSMRSLKWNSKANNDEKCKSKSYAE